ncbi:MAG: S8 family serine peptidase [Candidatus Sedimenticola sp. 20ELBAFRAG]
MQQVIGQLLKSGLFTLSLLGVIPAASAETPQGGRVLGGKLVQPAPPAAIRKKPKGFAPRPGGGFAPSTVDNETSSGNEEAYEDPADYEYPTVDSGPFVPSSGGSLLGEGLPSPPQMPVLSKGDEKNVEPGEIVVASASMDEAQALSQQLSGMGMGVKRRTALPNLGFVISTFRLPPESGVGDQVQQLKAEHPDLWVAPNHRYRLQSSNRGGERVAHRLIGWTADPACGKGAIIGLIDTQVAAGHPSLDGGRVVSRSFLSRGITPAPADHGTAIAVLLAGMSDSAIPGLLPQAELRVAEVFRSHGGEPDTTAESLVKGVEWLLGEGVMVINMSLAGPRNLLLERALEQAAVQGVVVVAAAGNDRDDEAGYPAAQQGVIAVTAVDRNLKNHANAARGEYMDFSAPGVDLRVSSVNGRSLYRSGTSYATPFVTAVIADAMLRYGRWDSALYDQLARQASDLGAASRDPVYGWGLIQSSGRCFGSQ